VLGFALCFAVRGAVIDRPAVAYDHALAVVEAERSRLRRSEHPQGVTVSDAVMEMSHI